MSETDSQDLTSLSSEAFSSLFPLDISSKQSLTVKAFNGSIESPFFSAVWRHFLLIFPSRRSQILNASEWLSALEASRNVYTKCIENSESRLEQFKRGSAGSVAMSVLGKTLIDLHDSLTGPVLSKLMQIVALLADDRLGEEHGACVAFLVANFYHLFLRESRPNFDGSPRSVLMDSEFVMHDVYGSVKKLINAMSLFFSGGSVGDSILAQIQYMVKKVNPFVDTGPGESDLPGILQIYHKLFAMYVSEPRELFALWTMLFSRVGDLTIFHYFYVCLYLVTGKTVPNPQPKQMLLYGKQFLHDFEGVVIEVRNDWETAQRLCEVIEDLIKMMEGESDDCIDSNRRTVLKYQLSQIIRIGRCCGGHPDELMPTDLILRTISK